MLIYCLDQPEHTAKQWEKGLMQCSLSSVYSGDQCSRDGGMASGSLGLWGVCRCRCASTALQDAHGDSRNAASIVRSVLLCLLPVGKAGGLALCRQENLSAC